MALVRLVDRLLLTGSVTLENALTVSTSSMTFYALPASDPGVAGRVYVESSILKVSAG